MRNIKAAIDAPEDYWINLSSKACTYGVRHLELRNPENCFGARVIKYLDPNILDVRVWLHQTFIHFKDQPIPWKYDNSAEMHRIASLNDKKGKPGLLQALRLVENLDEIKIKLLKPRKSTSYAWTRSDEFKEIRRSSRKKRNLEIARGAKKRKYVKPYAIGLRNGQGKAHTWEE
jgi:hypothetical protein